MSTLTVTTSSELMENYIQSDILLPQDQFIALQTQAGASLLFSIGTGGVFNLTMEVPGIRYGWQLADLSSARIQQDFPGGATCKNFAAAQAVGQQPGQPAQIQLAMVLNDGTNDHLYLSLANSDSDLSWANAPAWTPCPYNAVDATGAPIAPPSPFLIAGLFISEATDGQFIVVDAIRNPSEPAGVLSRFYLNVTAPSSPVWMPHNLAADIQAGNYQSCLGRTTQAFGVDGIYTNGTIGTSAQLIYTPLYNVFDPSTPPLPSRLNLPGSLTADAIAASRNADNTSDLYAAAQGSLYYFASSNQHDGAVAELLVHNDLLSGVRAMFAYASDGNVTVWGLNGSDEVFYLTCAQAQVGTTTAWSFPVAILTGVDAIAPYIDRAYNANTFFAHGGNGLVKAVKTPATGLWSRRNITLPPSDTTQAATAISSYTTHIQVTDANGQAAVNVPVALTATSVTSVSINHLYYIIGSEPVQVSTDELGTITIIETATTLAGTRFNAVVAQQPATSVNPMDTAFQRNAAYNSAASLQSAVITNRDGTTRPFIPAGTSTDTLTQVAQSNQSLASAYTSMATSTPRPANQRAMFGSQRSAALATAGFGDAIATDIGDLFMWLESGVEALITIIEDAATGLWHFVATIAGDIYSAVLDCVEAVVAAATWIYNAIKIVIEDIIQFLEFLFGWQDILTTHNVLKNVFLQMAQYAIDGLETSKGQVASIFTQLQKDINQWAGFSGFDQTPGSTASANAPLAGQNSAPSNVGVHHFQGNCGNSATGYAPLAPAEAIFQDLINLLASEQTTLTDACNQIKTQIFDQFSSLSLDEIIKRFIAIVADTILQSAENVIVTVLDVFAQLVSGLIDALTATIDIPVLSWLYKELTGNDLSFLDLACLIAAIPATLIYKASADAAPFPSSSAFTTGLLNATSFAEVQAQFVTSPSARTLQSVTEVQKARVLAVAAADPAPVLDQDKLKVFGIVAGVAALTGSVVLAITSTLSRALANTGLPAAFAKTLATINCVANILYVSPNIATLINVGSSNEYSQLNNVLTGISIVKGMAAIPLADSESKAIQLMFPTVETIINIVWNIPVIDNLVVNGSAWNSTYKSIIPESIGNFAFNLGGMMEILLTEPPLQFELAVEQAVFMVTYGAMMVVAGGIYEWAPNQSH